MPTIKDFVERLERDYLPSENEGMWRKTWVIPADKSISGNKTYPREWEHHSSKSTFHTFISNEHSLH